MLHRRHAEILRILDAEGTVSNARLASALGVSAETVRRDVRALADGGTVMRLHGGVGLAGQGGEAPFRARMRENAGAKQAIALAFAATVQNGESLMLDTGTTTSFVARALVRHRRLTVVTNSTDAARTLAGGEGNRVFLAGGMVRPDSGAVLGAEALRFVQGFSVAHAVISAGGLDAGEITDFDPEEADFARAVLDRGTRRVVVTDATKFGRRGLVSVARLDTLELLVTDAPPPPRVAGAAGGCRVLLA
ncbi:MAG TPA: DeoR/GlpR family DNA-binding transcription regulator [Paracoccaceae bacterium]|nr:DeoR/GlpR family DNA-binding transcription regulator [Paracoccaceae bacterium]HMO70136.1 DeoR/GlpR family DNA-binding transcription regulator [Paracoccaceae bacterium]